MFSFLSQSNHTGQPSTVLIKEANEHVRQLHAKVGDLESRVREQAELLRRRDSEHREQLGALQSSKDNEIVALQSQQIQLEKHCQQLEAVIHDREVQIAYLMHRCSFLDEAASYAPLIEQLAHCLKTSVGAPPPKVRQAKNRQNLGQLVNENHEIIEGKQLSTISEESIKGYE